MKFATIALVATASAITLRTRVQDCVNATAAGEIFDSIDSNHNDQISLEELKTALAYFAQGKNYTVTEKDK